MNKKGFTLIELLATLIVLGIVVGITVVSLTSVLQTGKDKSEYAFVDTIEDALNMYLNGGARKLHFTNQVCTLDKTHKSGIKVYKATETVSFQSAIFSNENNYKQLVEDDFVNPKNGSKCNTGATISIYRDEDFVYYYKVVKSDLGCLTHTATTDEDHGIISNLPSTCAG